MSAVGILGRGLREATLAHGAPFNFVPETIVRARFRRETRGNILFTICQRSSTYIFDIMCLKQQ